MPLDCEKECREAYRANVEEVRTHLDAGKLAKKIASFCELRGLGVEEVAEEIRKNKVVACMFAIDPKMQNFFEKLAARHIGPMEGVRDFKSLGTDNLYVSNGGVFTKEEKDRTGFGSTAKTIDFSWEFGKMMFFASHKHTKGVGGAQGNPFNDLKNFITESNRASKEHNRRFVAIADGSYHRSKNRGSSVTRMQELKDLANRTTVFACDIEELPNLMREIAGR